MGDLPKLHARGGALYADLRPWGGQKHTALGLPADADRLAAGMAVAAKLAETRVRGAVAAPELPGLDKPGLTMNALLGLYQEAREYETRAGEKYVAERCRYVAKGIGHLTVEQLSGRLGTVALRAWRDKLREAKCGPRHIRNVLNQATAALRWGQEDGRELTGPLPRRPKYGHLPEPVFRTLPEADFRHLREHLFDEAIRWGTVKKWATADGCTEEDYIARRRMVLSAGFYLGAHPEDANTLRGEDLSVDVGRYTRRNTKSSRIIAPDVFDMPEAFRLDCEAELRRRGIPRFPPDEVIGGPRPWRQSSRVLASACARLWPDGPTRFASFQVLRRSCVWEYTIRGWRTHEIAAIVGHVDETMIRTIYRRCSQLALISPVRVPWAIGTGPRGEPTRHGKVIRFAAGA